MYKLILQVISLGSKTADLFCIRQSLKLTPEETAKHGESQVPHLVSTCGGKTTCGSWNRGKARVTAAY